jgi:hypothetical protein
LEWGQDSAVSSLLVSIEKKSFKNRGKPLGERTSVSYPHPFNADLDPDLASNINADPGPYILI